MPERALDALRALAEAARGAGSVEEAQRAALAVLTDHSAELAADLAELDRSRQRALDLERLARQRADEADEARLRFMDNVSHELRTPLNGIMGYLDLLSEGIGGVLTEAQESQIQRIRAGALRLKEMIEEILTFSRIQAGDEALDLEETDLGAAVAEVGALLRPLLEDKALAFEVILPEDPIRIRTDAVKLRQVLMNLLSNAQKYTDRGRVELSLASEAGQALIAVRDTGPGIAVRDHEKIFHPFQRLPSRDTRGGTGLGLSVSRSLVALLGGELTLESEPGRGSAFLVRLPLQPSSDEGEAVEPAVAQAKQLADGPADGGNELPVASA